MALLCLSLLFCLMFRVTSHPSEKRAMRDQPLPFCAISSADKTPLNLSKFSESIAVIQAGSQLGNGVVVGTDGLILTAVHLLHGARKVTVYLPGKEALTGRLLQLFPSEDMALISVKGPKLPCVPIAKRLPLVGSQVFILGFQPKGRLGEVLFETEVERLVSIPGKGLYIQTNLNLPAGNSGSPMLNEQGELVGIISEKIEQAPLRETRHQFHTLGTSTLFLVDEARKKK
jgi:S1-C subfamily serine protease